jgi:uncharacterized OsmC-like protein
MAGDSMAIARVRCRALRGFVSEVTAKDQAPIVVDEPRDFVVGALAGEDAGWTPIQYLLGALSSCANVAVAIVAGAQGFALDGLEIRAEAEVDLRGLVDGDPDRSPRFQAIDLEFRAATVEPAERIEALARESDRRCPQLGLIRAAGVPLTQRWTVGGVEVCVLRSGVA